MRYRLSRHTCACYEEKGNFRGWLEIKGCWMSCEIRESVSGIMGEVIVAKLCVIFVGKGNEEILSLKEIA